MKNLPTSSTAITRVSTICPGANGITELASRDRPCCMVTDWLLTTKGFTTMFSTLFTASVSLLVMMLMYSASLLMCFVLVTKLAT